MAEQRGDDAEQRLIESHLAERWELEAAPPDWVVDAARSDGLAADGADPTPTVYDGADYEYKVVPAASGASFHVFLRPHDEHVRPPYSDECPHCEHRIAKGEDESVLYCDDCGWSPGDFVNGDVGVCPHCDQHISRDEDETFLQCPDCGWTVGLPLLRHLLWRR